MTRQACSTRLVVSLGKVILAFRAHWEFAAGEFLLPRRGTGKQCHRPDKALRARGAW